MFKKKKLFGTSSSKPHDPSVRKSQSSMSHPSDNAKSVNFSSSEDEDNESKTPLSIESANSTGSIGSINTGKLGRDSPSIIKPVSISTIARTAINALPLPIATASTHQNLHGAHIHDPTIDTSFDYDDDASDESDESSSQSSSTSRTVTDTASEYNDLLSSLSFQFDAENAGDGIERSYSGKSYTATTTTTTTTISTSDTGVSRVSSDSLGASSVSLSSTQKRCDTPISTASEETSSSVAADKLSVPSDGKVSPPLTTSLQLEPSRRRSFFSSIFGSSSGDTSSNQGQRGQSLSLHEKTMNYLKSDKDSKLLAIGRQIGALEKESLKKTETEKKEFKTLTRPLLESQIQEIEQSCIELKKMIEEEVVSGLEAVAELEARLAAHTEVLEDLRKKVSCPHSVIVLGSGGVYLGLDDVWLENCTGYLDLECVPSRSSPYISMILGADAGPSGGMSCRVKVEGFRLVGEKGKGVPKIRLESLKVTFSVRVSILVHFDSTTNEWTTNSKNFKVDLLSFKGPYGTRKSMIGATLSLTIPILRKKMLAALPPELGLMMKTLSSPVQIKGSFSVAGMQLAYLTMGLSAAIADSASHSNIAQLLNLAPCQTDLFISLLKYGLGGQTTSLVTLQDILVYMRQHRKNPRIWRSLVSLWEEAVDEYVERAKVVYYSEYVQALTEAGGSGSGVHTNERDEEVGVEGVDGMCAHSPYSLKFSEIITNSEVIRRKKLRLSLSLQKVDGQVSVNQLLRHVSQFLHRFASQDAEIGVSSTAASKPISGKPDREMNTSIKEARMMALLERIQNNYELGLEVIKFISRNLDWVQFLVSGSLHSGVGGLCKMEINSLYSQFPLLLDTIFSKDKSLGYTAMVPFILTVKPKSNGDIEVEMMASGEGEEGGAVSSSTSTSAPSSAPTSPPTSTSATHPQYQPSMTGMCPDSPFTPVSSYIRQQNAGMGGMGGKAAELIPVQSKDPEQIYDLLIALLSICRPHVSLCVDSPVSLKPGSELFSVMLGPRCDPTSTGDSAPRTKLPFGAPNMMHLAQQREQQAGAALAPLFDATPSTAPPIQPTSAPSPSADGCKVFLQTAPGIKFLAQIPKIFASVYLPALLSFLQGHFSNLPLLQEYLQNTLGGIVLIEHLDICKVVLTRIRKYLLVPGLEVDARVQIKITAVNSELLVRVLTPEVEIDEYGVEVGGSAGKDSEIAGETTAPHVNPSSPYVHTPYAVRFKAYLSLLDLIEDTYDVAKSIKESRRTTGGM